MSNSRKNLVNSTDLSLQYRPTGENELFNSYGQDNFHNISKSFNSKLHEINSNMTLLNVSMPEPEQMRDSVGEFPLLYSCFSSPEPLSSPEMLDDDDDWPTIDCEDSQLSSDTLASWEETYPSNRRGVLPNSRSMKKRTIKSVSIFKKRVSVFMKNSTSIQFSTESSLSDLSFDDDQPLTREHKDRKNDVFHDSDDEMLAACIGFGMPTKKDCKKRTLLGDLRHITPTEQYKESTSPNAESLKNLCTNVLGHKAPLFYTEDTPANISHDTSHSDLSLFTQSDESDQEKILNECIRFGMSQVKMSSNLTENNHTSMKINPLYNQEKFVAEWIQFNIPEAGVSPNLSVNNHVQNIVRPLSTNCDCQHCEPNTKSLNLLTPRKPIEIKHSTERNIKPKTPTSKLYTYTTEAAFECNQKMMTTVSQDPQRRLYDTQSDESSHKTIVPECIHCGMPQVKMSSNLTENNLTRKKVNSLSNQKNIQVESIQPNMSQVRISPPKLTINKFVKKIVRPLSKHFGYRHCKPKTKSLKMLTSRKPTEMNFKPTGNKSPTLKLATCTTQAAFDPNEKIMTAVSQKPQSRLHNNKEWMEDQEQELLNECIMSGMPKPRTVKKTSQYPTFIHTN